MNQVLYRIRILIMYVNRFSQKMKTTNGFTLPELLKGIIGLTKRHLVFKKLNKSILDILETKKLEDYNNNLHLSLHNIFDIKVINTRIFKEIVKLRKRVLKSIYYRYDRIMRQHELYNSITITIR